MTTRKTMQKALIAALTLIEARFTALHQFEHRHMLPGETLSMHEK